MRTMVFGIIVGALVSVLVLDARRSERECRAGWQESIDGAIAINRELVAANDALKREVERLRASK